MPQVKISKRGTGRRVMSSDKRRVVSTETDNPEQERVRKFLALAGERFRRTAEAESSVRKASLEDVKFSLGEQWDPKVKQDRINDRRPCLTLNRATPFIKQVTNNQRQQRPGIVVNPIGSGSDPDVAEIFQGMVRHVDVNSDGEIAYDTAFEWMVRGGFAYWWFVTDYVDDKSFNQEIKRCWIEDPFSVYYDPDCTEYDGSDADFVFKVRDFEPEEYKDQYQDSEAASLTDFTSIGNSGLQYGLGKDRIRVADYFYVVKERSKLHLLKDGSALPENIWDALYKDEKDITPGREIVKSRTVVTRKVKWAKINATEILEERDWPGKYIPVVRLLGHSMTVDGKKYLSGLIRDFKDPQRMYNTWVSAATEKIALDPKAPWMIAEGQDEGFEHEYEISNRKNIAAIHYKPKTVGDQLVPPPARQFAQSQIDGYVRLIAQADSDMKAITGIYDPSLGQYRADESGRAVLARQKQTDVGNFDFSDNLARSIRHDGRILIDLFPRVYDAARIQRIIRPDGAVDHVGVFNSQHDGQTMESVQQLEEMQAVKKIYDIGTGKYDVTPSAGPSYQSRRQEAVQSMTALITAYPQIFSVLGDILVQNYDWPEAKECAKRLKKMVPANVLDDSDESPEAKEMRMHAQLQQMTQQHEALVKTLEEANEIIRSKRLEVESRERIAGINAMAQMTAASLKMHGDAGLELMKVQFGAITKRLELLHQSMSIEQEDGEGQNTGVPSPAAMPTPTPAAQPQSGAGA